MRTGRLQPIRSAAASNAAPWLFFALTFLWSWSCWGLAIRTGQPWTALPNVVLYALGGVGPSLVAVALVHLRADVESPALFWRRVVDVRRIRPRWYLILVLVAFAPGLIATLAPTGMDGPGAEPGSTLGAGILIVALGAALAEELGWRGYALDALLKRRSALAASLVVGVAWTIWHLPLYFMAGTIQQHAGLWSLDFWSDMLTRIPFAVLFTWIYMNTGRSILAAMLLHAFDNVASVVIDPVGAQVLVRLAVVAVLAASVSLRLSPSSGREDA